MARLRITSAGFEERIIELRPGVNRFGRSAANDFQVEHPTISGSHCQIVFGGEGLLVRDCDSTNGTFVQDHPIREAKLSTGQILRLGEVEFLVESAQVTVAIPAFDVPRPAPPVMLGDGSLLCPRHPEARVTHQCTHCREVMCEACVHRLRRRGGKTLKLCPLCSHKCQPIGGEKRKKEFSFRLFKKTVKVPFLRAKTSREDEEGL